MRERVSESPIKFWILMEANRLMITAILAIIVFLTFMVLAVSIPGPVSLGERDVILFLFSAMLTAIATGVTLVVTISQLIISEENGPLGDQRERMESTMAVREEIRSHIEQPVPADPAQIVLVVLETLENRARTLSSQISDGTGSTNAREPIQTLETIVEDAETVSNRLNGAQFGSFAVLSTALDFNYAEKISQMERMLHADGMPPDSGVRDRAKEIRQILELYGPVREHIKTLYFQWALIDLSRLILYISIPALAVSGYMVVFVSPETIEGTFLGIENLLWIMGVVFTFALAPFLLLTAYIVRITTTAKRTLAIGPLVLRDH